MARTKKRKRALREWLLITFGLVIGLGVAVCIFLWLMVAHVPDWYTPPRVPEAEYQRVRDSLVDTVSDFSDDLVDGRPFDLTLDDDTVSRWISARSVVWPDAGAWVPPFLQEPVVVFRPGRVILAARIEQDGWQTIASLHIAITVAQDQLHVRLERVAGGSLSIPVNAIADRVPQVLSAAGQDADAMPDLVSDAVRFLRREDAVELLKEGITVENRFRWENGKRWFRIQNVEVKTGQLHLKIEPLPHNAGASQQP